MNAEDTAPTPEVSAGAHAIATQFGNEGYTHADDYDRAEAAIRAAEPILRERIASEVAAASAAVTDFIRWYEQHDAAVWAETPEEAAEELLGRIGNVIRGAS